MRSRLYCLIKLKHIIISNNDDEVSIHIQYVNWSHVGNMLLCSSSSWLLRGQGFGFHSHGTRTWHRVVPQSVIKLECSHLLRSGSFWVSILTSGAGTCSRFSPTTRVPTGLLCYVSTLNLRTYEYVPNLFISNFASSCLKLKASEFVKLVFIYFKLFISKGLYDLKKNP